jgi:hypothetical protein
MEDMTEFIDSSTANNGLVLSRRLFLDNEKQLTSDANSMGRKM